MSKYSIFWGKATGKLGNMVLSTVRGQEIQKAYQPTVLNPKSAGQMAQRARFSNMVKFYKRAVSNFFMFAYEDKSQTESYYNAFMRHNTNNGALLTKEQVKGVFPALGYDVMLSQGSLNPAVINNLHTSNIPTLQLASLTNGSADSTIADVSKAMYADYGLSAGDIVTLVIVSDNVTSLTATPSEKPTWYIAQFELDGTNTAKLAEKIPYMVPMAGAIALDSEQRTNMAGYSIIFSSKTAGQTLRVSDSYLYGNKIAVDMYNASLTDEWRKQVLKSWGAGGTAVLEGSYLGYSTGSVSGGDASEATITEATPSTITSAGNTAIAITGTNLTKLSVSSFAKTNSNITLVSYVAGSETAATLNVSIASGASVSGNITYNGTTIASVNYTYESGDTGFQG